MTGNTHVGDVSTTRPNAERSYQITADDLPVHCPMPGSSLWNSHPQVFIALDENGHGKCPYCGAEYQLVT